MTRIKYHEMTADQLGVVLPDGHIVRCPYDLGWRHRPRREPQMSLESEGRTEWVDPVAVPDADALVLMPDWSGPDDDAIVIIVNDWFMKTDSFIHELIHLTTSNPDSPGALVFVPEKDIGSHAAQDAVTNRLAQPDARRLGPIEICSYYPA